MFAPICITLLIWPLHYFITFQTEELSCLSSDSGEFGTELFHHESHERCVNDEQQLESWLCVPPDKNHHFWKSKLMDPMICLVIETENILHVIDLREFAGKSNANVERIKGRIIGNAGRARINMENLTSTHISVYGRTVSIIGNSNKLKLAVDAICAISSGGMHGAVYDKLESANRRTKQEKMLLWENQDVLY